MDLAAAVVVVVGAPLFVTAFVGAPEPAAVALVGAPRLVPLALTALVGAPRFVPRAVGLDEATLAWLAFAVPRTVGRDVPDAFVGAPSFAFVGDTVAPRFVPRAVDPRAVPRVVGRALT